MRNAGLSSRQARRGVILARQLGGVLPSILSLLERFGQAAMEKCTPARAVGGVESVANDGVPEVVMLDVNRSQQVRRQCLVEAAKQRLFVEIGQSL